MNDSTADKEFPSLLNGRLQSDFINALGVSLGVVLLLPLYGTCNEGTADDCGTIGLGFAWTGLVLCALLLISIVATIVALGKMKAVKPAVRRINLNLIAMAAEFVGFLVIAVWTKVLLTEEEVSSHLPAFWIVPFLVAGQALVQLANMFFAKRWGTVSGNAWWIEIGQLVGIAAIAVGAFLALATVSGSSDTGRDIAAALVGGLGWAVVEALGLKEQIDKQGKGRRGYDGALHRPVSRIEVILYFVRFALICIAVLMTISVFLGAPASLARWAIWLAGVGVVLGLFLAVYNLVIKIWGKAWSSEKLAAYKLISMPGLVNAPRPGNPPKRLRKRHRVKRGSRSKRRDHAPSRGH